MDKVFKIIVRLLVVLGLSMAIVNSIRWEREKEIRETKPLENITERFKP